MKSKKAFHVFRRIRTERNRSFAFTLFILSVVNLFLLVVIFLSSVENKVKISLLLTVLLQTVLVLPLLFTRNPKYSNLSFLPVLLFLGYSIYGVKNTIYGGVASLLFSTINAGYISFWYSVYYNFMYPFISASSISAITLLSSLLIFKSNGSFVVSNYPTLYLYSLLSLSGIYGASFLSGTVVNRLLYLAKLREILLVKLPSPAGVKVISRTLKRLLPTLHVNSIRVSGEERKVFVSRRNGGKTFRWNFGFCLVEIKAHPLFKFPILVEWINSIAATISVLFLKVIFEEEKKEYQQRIEEILVDTIELRDPYTKGHSANVTHYSLEIGKALGLTSNQLEKLEKAALFHDIGKIVTPDKILLKPTKLTEEEYEVIKLHPTVGYLILKEIKRFEEVATAVKHHHERWDGSGYPDGLKGEEIPLLSRIIAVADVFDALTSDRPYRKGLTADEALKIIMKEREKYDPKVLEVAEKVLKSVEPVETFSLKMKEAEFLDMYRKLLSWSSVCFGNCTSRGNIGGVLVEFKEFSYEAYREFLKLFLDKSNVQVVLLADKRILIISGKDKEEENFKLLKSFPKVKSATKLF